MQIPSTEMNLNGADNGIHHNRNFRVTRASRSNLCIIISHSRQGSNGSAENHRRVKRLRRRPLCESAEAGDKSLHVLEFVHGFDHLGDLPSDEMP